MRLLLGFARAHPARSLSALLCLLLSGAAEGVGMTSVLPLLQVATSPQAPGSSDNGLERHVHSALGALGLEPTLGVLFSVIVAGMSLKAALVVLAHRQVGYTVAAVATDLRLSLVRALVGARWSYFTRQPVGAVAAAFSTEAERASQAFLHGMAILAAILQAALYAAIALAISWQAAAAALAAGALTSLLLQRLVRSARRAGRKQTKLLSAALRRLSDTLQAVKPLKAMAREALMGPLLERETRHLDRALRGEVLSKHAMKALQEPLVVMLLAAGGYAAITRWGLPLATLLMLALLFQRTLGALNQAQREYQALMARESAHRALSGTIARARAEAEACEGTLEPSLTQAIELRHVSLAYGDKPALEDVSLSVPAGSLTALVGPSGAGKTSIADLVLGLVQPMQGQVLIDGVPLQAIDLRRWRSQVGYVPQELLLLHDTVYANVSLGDPELGEEAVARALRAAGAEGFVARLPRGMHTPVGERGTLLSGGERQRIAIARALVHAPKLLVLDEATTALDPATEAAVCATVSRLRGPMTILAISHQQAIVDLADRVYRIENGMAKQIAASA